MVLSKPIQHSLLNFAAFYLTSLHNNPIRTKSLTSCCIASLGNLTSQTISGSQKINPRSTFAFGLFGLLFGGPLPHFFYTNLERMFPSSTKSAIFCKLLIERLIYAPFYQMVSLYMLARFEGKSHEAAKAQLDKLYWTVLNANWKFLTFSQFINMAYIPPMFRVLWVNTVGFFWAIFLASMRRKSESPKSKSQFRKKNVS